MTDDLERDDGPPVPSAVHAERAVIGSVLLAPTVLPGVRAIITAADFWRPAHETLFALLCDLADAGTTIDPITVLGELDRRSQTRAVGGATYLHTLIGGVATAGNAAHYAVQVRATSRRRQLVTTGQRIVQIGTEVPDLDDALAAAARETITLELLVDETLDGPVDGLATWHDFLNQPDRAEDWIVPGLLEHHDVVMILATPGAGKSWLSRQVALTVAAGVHPFRPDVTVEPVRTLLVDLENPPAMVRRQTRPLANILSHIGSPSADRAHLWAQPGGINIRRRADAQLLERVIAETRPDLVCLGSLYNAFERGRDDWDTAAEEAKSVFNRLRARYRCAFWIEHHMPKQPPGAGHKSPFGSSVWERWPGFGRVIDRKGDNVYELAKTFRGDRDVREFPVGLYRGGVLPWSSVWSPDDLDAMAESEKPRR